jgi:CRP-like cAMP-binding protein
VSKEFDFTRGWPFRPVPKGAGGIPPKELQAREEALASVPLFQGLSARQRRALAKVTSIARHRPDTTLVKQGSPGTTFFVILEGEVEVLAGRRSLARLGPGEFFGELSLIDGDPRMASVVSRTPTTSLNLNRRHFTDLLAKEPDLSMGVMRVLARRLRAAEASPA